MAQSFEGWFQALGPVTRAVLCFSVGLSALSSLGAVSAYYYVLLPGSLWRLQLWRLLTATFFLGNFSFSWLMSVGMLVTYVRYNEEEDYKGRTADMVWMLLVVSAALCTAGLTLGLPIVSFAFTMSLCWLFCKRHPERRMTLFGFEFGAPLFPWVLMAFHVILGQGVVEDVCGIAVGHAFFFLHDMLPTTHGTRVLETPALLKRYLPSERPAFGAVHPEVHPTDARFQRPNANQNARHSWGAGGHRLGSN